VPLIDRLDGSISCLIDCRLCRRVCKFTVRWEWAGSGPGIHRGLSAALSAPATYQQRLGQSRLPPCVAVGAATSQWDGHVSVGLPADPLLRSDSPGHHWWWVDSTQGVAAWCRRHEAFTGHYHSRFIHCLAWLICIISLPANGSFGSGFMFYCRSFFLFYARSPRCVGRLVWNFAWWSVLGRIL